MFRVLPGHAERVKQAIDTLAECYAHIFANDMLITLDRNASFLEDARFMQAFNAAAADETEKSLLWRVHVLCWVAHNSLRVEGDFVECGVFRGMSTAVLAPYLDFARQPRSWYLYDTFTGIPADQLNPGHGNPDNYQAPGLYEAAVQRFAPYPNIRVVRGRVPEVLAEGAATVGLRGVEPDEWVVTVGQHLLHGQDATSARVRPVTWERVLELQGLQREDVLRGFLDKQQRLARSRGAVPPTNEEFLKAGP